MWQAISKAIIKAIRERIHELPERVRPAASAAVLCGMFVFVMVTLFAILSQLPDHRVVDLLLISVGIAAVVLLVLLVICVIFVVIGALQPFFDRA